MIMEKLKCGNFFVSKRNDGKFEILKYDNNAKMITDAMIDDGEVFIWEKPETFDSKFKAYAWLKANMENLI